MEMVAYINSFLPKKLYRGEGWKEDKKYVDFLEENEIKNKFNITTGERSV